MRNILAAGDPTLKLDVIEFGIDYAQVRRNSREYADSSEITIGLMSMLAPHKGAHVLVDAFKQASVRNMRVWIYGEPLYTEDYYEELKVKIGNDTRIELRGKYASEEMTEILNQLDVLVMPSLWWENTPLVLLMGLAHNVPAIVADVPGLTEVVRDGVNGFVFEPGNATSLAQVLQRVGSRPSILNDLKRGMAYPPRVEEMGFRYERLYEDVLRTRGHALSNSLR
jgi:glycosyltransferase involved in cell wall biosynthesis